jgi:hypothetical protein
MLEEALAAAPIAPERALEVLRRLAGALEAARGRGIGRPQLAVPRSAALQYVSPERMLGGREGPASDVYSLGTVFFHCLTGRPPFPLGERRAVTFWHLHAPRPRATEARSELPPAVDRLIARAMAIDPARRHPDPRALIEEAQAIFGAAEPSVPTSRSHGAIAWLAAAALVALAAGTAGFAVAAALDEPQPSQVRAGVLDLTVGADWVPARTPSLRSALRLDPAVALAPRSGGEGTLVAGIGTPAATVRFLSHLDADHRSGELVRLGRVQARRYRAARGRGRTSPVQMYVTPVDGGIATIACVAKGPAGAMSFMASCESIAGSLRIARGHLRPVRASRHDAATLARALRRLNAARSRYRARLVRARTPSQQATAAAELVPAHARAAHELRSLSLTSLAAPGGAAAVRALERATRAYRSASRAARRHDRTRYASARRAALAADHALRRALLMLRVGGFGR